jgi:hypothetical protein
VGQDIGARCVALLGQPADQLAIDCPRHLVVLPTERPGEVRCGASWALPVQRRVWASSDRSECFLQARHCLLSGEPSPQLLVQLARNHPQMHLALPTVLQPFHAEADGML